MATPQTHKVLRGENFSIIAKNYSVSLDELIKLNGLTRDSRLNVGQTLNIPEKKIRKPAAAEPDKSGGDEKLKWSEKTIHPDEDSQGHSLKHGLLDRLLSMLRANDANERVQQTEKVAIDKDAKSASYTQKPSKRKDSKTNQERAEVIQQLKQQLGPPPREVKVTGVQLTKNERLQIVASVATCEMDGNGLSSINADKEFEGEMTGVSYGRIVHIGLSYGLIQFAQDVGPLGAVLKEMQKKDSAKFTEIFGGGDQKIADSLVELTNEGHPNVRSNPEIPLCGLNYWKGLKGNEKRKELEQLLKEKGRLPVDKEIRGRRVQPLIPKQGEAAIDIWTGVWKERFLAAGKVPAFQEVQLDFAVKEYVRPVLPKAKKLNVRTALALAFLVACKVRGDDMDILEKVAEAEGIKKINAPFESGADEKKCIDAIVAPYGEMEKEIAKAKKEAKTKSEARAKVKEIVRKNEYAKVHGYQFLMVVAQRAAELKKDELGFLAEDLYDLASYV